MNSLMGSIAILMSLAFYVLSLNENVLAMAIGFAIGKVIADIIRLLSK